MADIVALPDFMPVTNPLVDTVATALLLELHWTEPCEAFAGMTEAPSVTVLPVDKFVVEGIDID